MSNINPSSKRTNNRPWAALLPVLVLAPLAMAPKGCEPVVVGDDCPDEISCSAGAAGKPGGIGGSAGKPSGSAGSAGKPSGSAGSSAGNACGGLLGLGCADSEYCAFDVTAACGAADQTGVCKPKPQICGDIYAPVCACDGQTYENECSAAAKGSSVAHTGACDGPAPGTVCGGLKPAACAKSEYCNYPPETKCGSGDQTGTCTKIPDACDTKYEPVCGCDNVSYGNSCEAAGKGVSVLHSGKCADEPSGALCGGLLGASCTKGEFCDFPLETKCGSGDQTGTCATIPSGACTKEYVPVCGCDGNTYGNACTARAAGVSLAATGACSPICGGNTGKTCAAAEYCSYPPAAKCGAFDATGTCVPKVTNGACTANYDPVCGCDGKTYGNSCEAGLAFTSVSAVGACP